MARIRSIKPEFWTSEQIVECSTSARLLFIGLWNFCDDGGVHPDSPKRIKMEIFPGDPLSNDDVKALVDELVLAKLVMRFDSDGKSYLAVTGWHHQKIERPSHRWPQPPNDLRSVVEQSSNSRRTCDDDSPPEGSGVDKDIKPPCIPPKRTRSKKFVKPTAAEVEAYCLERKNGISGQDFVDSYDRVGWVVGRNKTPMRDWKAAVRTWERHQREQSPQRRGYDVTAEDDAQWTP
jgi:hypothetical protein